MIFGTLEPLLLKNRLRLVFIDKPYYISNKNLEDIIILGYYTFLFLILNIMAILFF